MDNINKALEYGANAIKETIGAEKHRINVSQYLGADDSVGIENQLFEILDNSIDECLEYRARLRDFLGDKADLIYLPPMKINLEITPTDDVIIEDQGRGIPVLLHPTTNQPTIFRIYESDSAGGKGNLSQGGYISATAGMHGAGAAVSKSCTSRFEITTKTLGKDGEGMGIYTVTYIDGERDTTLGVNGLSKIGDLQLSPVPEFAQLGLMDTGTKIRYRFAEEVFTRTRDGQPSDAYSKDSILERIRYILLGVEDKDALNIKFKFKDDDEIIISPRDFTPETFLKVTNLNDFLAVRITSQKERTDPAWFDASIYINRSGNGLSFKSKTVVNRLSLDEADSNEIVRSAIKNIYDNYIGYPLKEGQENIATSVRNSVRAIASRMVDNHQVLIVMSLAKAKFDGQTKKNLKSKEYTPELRSMSKGVLSNYIESYFRKYIDEGNIELANTVQGLIYAEKQRQRELKKMQTEIDISNAIDTARQTVVNPLERLKQHMKIYDNDSKNMLTLKESIYGPQDSWLILVEGASAAGALGQIDDLPITVVGLQGKPSNVTNMKTIDKQQIKDLLTQFVSGYKAIGIMTDADSDGMHIRILLLAAIMRFIPNYIDDGRVFIINSPNARLQNISNEEIIVQVYNRTYKYPPGSMILTKTPAETEILMKKYKDKVHLFEKYGGLADSTTDGDSNLSLNGILKDPGYRCQVVSPSPEEKRILNDILSQDSALKKAIADEICTEKMRYIKNYSNINERIKLPTLNLFEQRYTSEPQIKDHETYSYEYITFQDVNEQY